MSIEKLSTNASLKDVMDKFEEISLSDFSSIDIITATELPSKGKEGQVCIITEHEPNNIYIGFDKPTLSEKDIYIKMEKGNPFKEFKILSSNKILSVRLVYAVQMQNGVETDLNGYIMKNGVWVSLDVKVYLYKEGTGDITDVTGGYLSSVYSPSSESAVRMSSSYLEVHANSGSYSSYAGTAGAVTNVGIDVTDLSKLKVIVSFSYTYKSSTSNSDIYGKIGLSTDKKANEVFTKHISFNKGGGSFDKTEMVLDISDLKGEYYFKVYASAKDTSSTVRIYDAWLE